MSRHLWILFFCISIFSVESYAQSIQWNQPEVVPEKLVRDKRRVLRFSGTSRPGTQVRVRDNKVKMIFSKNNIRWARIPTKHRVQFPVIASETGYLSFELYLPTTAVEIPLEVFRNGKWVPYRMSFDVPESGKADQFTFLEESFKTRRDEENVKVEDLLSEYDRAEDRGQIVNSGDRSEWKSWVTGKFFVWGSLGFMYYNLDQTLSPGFELGTMGGLSFPTWEIGAEYRWNTMWKAELSYINRAGDAEADGAYTLQNSDFNWTELRGQVAYFPVSWEKETHRLGIKGGLQMHEVPFIKQTNTNTARIYNNSMTFVSIGAAYETMNREGWNYDASALFLYPVLVDDDFDADSAYGLNLNFSMLKEIIPALYLGGKADFHYMTMDTTHKAIGGATTVNADLTLWQLTPSFILKAEF